MTNVAEAPPAANNPMAGFTVHRTSRDTWHVINRINGDHWESPNQAQVLASVDEYKANAVAREEARKAAEEAAKNPSLGEFGSTIPGEPNYFETFVPVGEAGKPNAPTVDNANAGAAPEPAQVDPAAGAITLSPEQFQALLDRANAGAAAGGEPEPANIKNAARED
jgi:hypothetical protein